MAFASDEIAGQYNPAAAPLGWTFGAPVPPRSRWLDAVSAVDRFLELMNTSNQNEFVSLSTYNQEAKIDVEMGNDYLRIQQAMFEYS